MLIFIITLLAIPLVLFTAYILMLFGIYTVPFVLVCVMFYTFPVLLLILIVTLLIMKGVNYVKNQHNQ